MKTVDSATPRRRDMAQPKAIICPHCGSARLDPQNRRGFYQCRDCDAHIDARTSGDYTSQTLAKATKSIVLGLLTFGLLPDDFIPDDIFDDLF